MAGGRFGRIGDPLLSVIRRYVTAYDVIFSEKIIPLQTDRRMDEYG